MSKKKKKVQPKKKISCRAKIITAVVVLAVIGAGVLTWFLVTKEPPLIVQYNTVMTAKAQAAGYISTEEVIIVHTVDDSAAGYTKLECYVYQVPEGVSLKKILKYYANELPEKWNMEQNGDASARFLKGDLDSLYALDVSLFK